MPLCLNCNKQLSTKRKYCNNQCQTDYQYKQYIIRWKAGEESGMRGKYQMSNHIRRYFVEKYNNQCQICSWGEINIYTKRVPLELEHIDGDYTNNLEKNLQLICPNCHSLTATYKGANKGQGRQDRKKYSLYEPEVK